MRLSVTNFVSFFAVLVLGFLASGVLMPLVLDSPVEGKPWLADVAAAVSSSSSSSFPHRLSLPAAPSVQVSNVENASGHRPLSNDLVPFGKALASPGSRSILSLDENKHDKFLLALPNGTIYFINRSKKPQWKLLTGRQKLFTTDDKILLNKHIPNLGEATLGKWLPLRGLAASGEFFLLDKLLKHNVDINGVDKLLLKNMTPAKVSKSFHS